MGLALSKQGRYEDAIYQFKKAIDLQKDFYDAYAEMGYAYADMGQMENAEEIHDFLEKKDSSLAYTLSLYLYKADTPKMMFAYFSSSFRYKMPANTPVSALDAYLSTAGATKTFTMKIQFDKEMDRTSIENRFNWTIARATGNGPGQAYNFGLPVSSTEVDLAPVPDQVIYDSKSLTATVYFKITQNETADGTIDPSHIEFTFNGKDIYGLKMDPESDQFCGFTGVA
jgi:tetratricopeptide (TPR) repeat protein